MGRVNKGLDAPDMQEAKKPNIGNIRHMSDAADQDAARADCDRINRTGH